MIPNVSRAGHSFKGAFAYYLHDKGQDADGGHKTTADRVAWTETRNLATDDPEAAKRIMIATARQAEALKAAAGIASTGRKSAAHVYSYSLAWHPDEAASLTRADMVKAADATLKALGAEGMQAVLVCHRDTKHPHVHVIINRVDPETGKMLATSNDFRKLDAWAREYERERGLIVTPKRQEKHDNTDKARAAHPDEAERLRFIKAKKARAQAVDLPRKAADPQAEGKPPTEGQILKDLSDAQKRDHKAQWAQLAEANKAKREAVYARFAAAMKDEAARHKAETKPAWGAHFKAERAADHARAKMERTFTGLVALALEAAKMQMRRGEAPARGLLSQTFANVLSRQLREASFAQAKAADRAALAATLKADLDGRMKRIRDQRAAALAVQRKVFEGDRAALIQKQDAERAKMREAWQQLYARRGKAITPRQENPAMKNEFDKRAQGLPPAPKMPTEPRFVAKASPAPAPMGAPPVPAKTLQNVPKPSPDMPKAQKAPAPSQAWSKAAPPAPEQPPRHADVWAKATEKPAQPREIKPLPTRSKDRDRDR